MNTDDRQEAIEVHIDHRGRQGGNRTGWRVWWRDADGHKHTREHRGWRRKHAEAEVRRILEELNRPANSCAWPDFVRRYLADQARRCRASTVAGIRQTLRAFEAATKVVRLEEVTRETISAYLAARQDGGLRAATLNRQLGILKAAFTWAIGANLYFTIDGAALCDRNPCRGLKRLREVHLPKVIYEDRGKCLRLADELADDGARWAAAALFMAECGLRIAEVGHLTWGSVNLSRREVIVQPEPDGWRPKGLGGRLVLGIQTVGALQKLAADSAVCPEAADQAAWRVCGGESPRQFERDFRERLKAACKRAALPAILPHGLRRSFGTILANAGLSPQQLQRVMRHSDIKTTLRYYVLVDERRAADEARWLLDRAD